MERGCRLVFGRRKAWRSAGSRPSDRRSPVDYVKADTYLREKAVEAGDNAWTDSIEMVLGKEAEQRMKGVYFDPADPRIVRDDVDFTGGELPRSTSVTRVARSRR
jgi:hypothetical protein